MKAALQKAQAKAEKAAATAQDAKETAPKKSLLPDYLSIGGTIEIEATDTETFAKSNTSDITLATAEAFIDARPSEYVMGHLLFLYEDDGTETVSIDEGHAVIGNTEKFPLFAQAGKYAVPFGNFDTAMSSDPLTLNIGEAKEKAAMVGAEWNGFSVSTYIFNGDTQKTAESNHIDQFGFSADYTGNVSGAEFSFGGSYINNIADSDGVTTGLAGASTALANYVPGVDVHGALTIAEFTIRGAYVTATRAFQVGELAFNGAGADIAAWHTEAAYTTSIMDREVTFAFTVQGTEEALALGLAERRIGGAVTVGVLEHAAVTVEYLHDDDYDTSKGGTGATGHTATVKLAVDF